MTTSPFGTKLLSLTTLLLLSTALPTLAAPAETPEAFVRRVYARYRMSEAPGVPADRKGGAPLYAAALLDAFARDQELSQGEVGAIDGDPIFDCQDYCKLRVRSVAITKGEAHTVKARVEFTNLQYHETVTLILAPTPAGWRIADVSNKSMKSVMAVLQDEIAHPAPTDPPSGATQPPKP